MSVTVPEGLSELLEEFAVAVLREKPSNLTEFAVRYFTDLHMSQTERSQTGGRQEVVAALSELASTAEVAMDADEAGGRVHVQGGRRLFIQKMQLVSQKCAQVF